MAKIKKGQKFSEVAALVQSEYNAPIALAIFNNKLKELFSVADEDGEVTFETIYDKSGVRCYRRSLILVLQKAFDDLYKSEGYRARILQTIGNGQYAEILNYDNEVSQEMLDQITEKMQSIIDSKFPIVKHTYSRSEALKLFKEMGTASKEKLFRYRRNSTVNMYELDGYQNYFYGFMLPSVEGLKFKLVKYQQGFVIQYPDKTTGEVGEFKPSDKLFATQRGSSRWSESLGIKNIGELNEVIVNNQIGDYILMQEAEMEDRIGKLADDIVKKGGRKFIMIAGPSSSGKTTFSHRLSLQLRARGLKPHPIPLDNYYLDRDKTPRDEFGNLDFECLESLDVEQFNTDMQALLRGEKVDMPIFNFKAGKREYRNNFLQLGEDDVLVIEGIHGLNDKLSYTLPAESKYKIYISALTQLSVDNHNALPTTDGRLIRRIVRDSRTRGSSAQETIGMWDSVRRGEEKYIFPFQEKADFIFNSALVYEIAVLKTYVEPQLFAIPEDAPEFAEANRLLKFLDYFLAIPAEGIVCNSLLREFIGGSCFNV